MYAYVYVFEDLSRLRTLTEAKVVPTIWIVDNILLKHILKRSGVPSENVIRYFSSH